MYENHVQYVHNKRDDPPGVTQYTVCSDYSRPRKWAGRHEKGAGRKNCSVKKVLLSEKGKKILTLYQISSCFMTLKEMHFENKEKKEKKEKILFMSILLFL